MFGRDAIRYQSHQNQGNLSANQCKELHKHFAKACSHCDTHATTLGRIIITQAGYVQYTRTHTHTQGNLCANQCKELHKHFAETCSHCDTHATTLGRIIVKRAVTYTNTHMHTYMHTYIHAHIRVSRHERDPVAAPEE